MKVSCDACQELGPLRLTATDDEGEVETTCEHCGRTQRIAVAARAAPRVLVDASRCPKCHAPVTAEAACAGCGLAAEHRARYVARLGAAGPKLEDAWRAVQAAWTEQARHDAFVQAAAGAGAFAWAARQYQDVCRQRPDDVIARRQLGRVRRTAEAAMLASARVRDVERPPYRRATGVLVLLVVLLAGGVMVSVLLRSSAPGAVSPRPVEPAPGGAPLRPMSPRRGT